MYLPEYTTVKHVLTHSVFIYLHVDFFFHKYFSVEVRQLVRLHTQYNPLAMALAPLPCYPHNTVVFITDPQEYSPLLCPIQYHIHCNQRKPCLHRYTHYLHKPQLLLLSVQSLRLIIR